MLILFVIDFPTRWQQLGCRHRNGIPRHRTQDLRVLKKSMGYIRGSSSRGTGFILFHHLFNPLELTSHRSQTQFPPLQAALNSKPTPLSVTLPTYLNFSASNGGTCSMAPDSQTAPLSKASVPVATLNTLLTHSQHATHMLMDGLLAQRLYLQTLCWVLN